MTNLKSLLKYFFLGGLGGLLVGVILVFLWMRFWLFTTLGTPLGLVFIYLSITVRFIANGFRSPQLPQGEYAMALLIEGAFIFLLLSALFGALIGYWIYRRKMTKMRQ
ncbi:MAG: hypothetical protein WC975_02895 [Phycisphaerae bacterium]